MPIIFNTGGQLEKLEAIQEWQLAKPATDLAWAEDVKKESLDVKYDYQLKEMKDSHEEKLPRVEKDLDVFTNWPDVERYKLTERFTQLFKDEKVKEGGKLEGKTLQEWIDEEFESQHIFYLWKVAKLQQSIERINKEIELREKGIVVPDKLEKGVENKDIPKDVIIRNIQGTVYYVDPVNGLAANTGLKLTGTVDSTADTSHFIDDALTGLDDYINGGYVYNSTRGIGAYITDFTAIDDQVHLASAIAGMAAGDAYYILCSWLDLDTFTEAARSAGDRCVVRRTAAANCDNGSDLTFTSSGTVVAPIVLESDFDDEYHDKVDLSATATATLTFGSKTVTFSAAINGVLAAGDWIYASGDDAREFAYEVASVDGDTVTVTLYLPYKGAQAGAGVTMYNIQDNPIWNTAAGDFQWMFDGDSCWKIQGIMIRGTDANGQVEIDSCSQHHFIDCEFIGNGASDAAIRPTDDYYIFIVKKSRIDDDAFGVIYGIADSYGYAEFYSVYADTGGAGFAFAFGGGASIVKMYDVEGTGTVAFSPEKIGYTFMRNINLATYNQYVGYYPNFLNMEDYENTVGDNRQNLGIGTSANTSQIQSEAGTVRAGGATQSIKVNPTTNFSNISGWNFSKVMLFELPIYATTDSKTYTVYFNLPDANFTADPTASELWIEIEAWGHAANNYRKITKSTGTVATDGAWNALTVTVAPAQAGIAYLRCYYCKTKEAASNIFYVDPIPTIA